MAQVKVSYKFNPSPYPYIMRNGRPKRGNFCRACGKPLKDAESIARGYGSECWKDIPVILVLDVQAVEHTLAPDGAYCACQVNWSDNTQICWRCSKPIRPAGKA